MSAKRTDTKTASTEATVHGVLAEFTSPESLLAACHAMFDAGYRAMDAYTPFPVEGLDQALGLRPTKIGWVVLLGAILGGLSGYVMMWYAQVYSYPVNIGGRPEHSWPAFIPITFELTILGAALSGFFAVFVFNKLPQPYHPVFNIEAFARASSEGFFLAIEARDQTFDMERILAQLATTQPVGVWQVPR